MAHQTAIPQQLLVLGGWRDVLDDIRRLCDGLNALPDACTCGQGADHLSGSCPCGDVVHTRPLPAREDCDRLLTELMPALDTLIVDTMRFFPVVNHLLQLHTRPSRQAVGAAIERQTVAVYRTFARLTAAVDEFRAGCCASHLKALKARANELSVKADQLDRTLRGAEA